MSVRRIEARVAGASVVGTGFVRRRRFVYHKRSVDGSAKANAVLTSSDVDRVWGVVYRLGAKEKAILDRYESLGIGYDHQLIDVTVGNDNCRAWIYVARQEMIDDRLQPYSWYHQLVIRGAEEHGLPEAYVDQLRENPVVRDPDQDRHDRNLRLLK